MGSTHSTWGSTLWEAWTNREIAPDLTQQSKHDPLYGFEERKPRVAKMTEDEMRLANIDPWYRDYCAHHLAEVFKCQRENFPFMGRCAHQKHEWSECEADDVISRFKEYERERRLLKREQKKKQKESAELLD